MYEPVLGVSAGDGHAQRIDDQLGPQVIDHRPADGPSRVELLHGCEVQPLLPGAQIRDADAPEDVQGRWAKAPFHEVIGDADAGQGGGLAKPRCYGRGPARRGGSAINATRTRSPVASRMPPIATAQYRNTANVKSAPMLSAALDALQKFVATPRESQKPTPTTTMTPSAQAPSTAPQPIAARKSGTP